MADEKLSLHIDNDWKKQAQEEKRRLAEQEAKVARPPVPPAPATGAGVDNAALGHAAPETSATTASAPTRSGRQPVTGLFATLVHSLLTQVFFSLGDLAVRGAESRINLDAARQQIDILGMLEEKTRGNLTDEERKLMDSALYQARMRFVHVAAEYT